MSLRSKSGGAAPDAAAEEPGSVIRTMVEFARHPDGTIAQFPLIAIRGAAPGPTAAFVAGVHGDEYEGPAALWALCEQLDPALLAGTVLVIPIANGAAFSAGTRSSPIDMANLARIFPGDPDGTLSYRLAHALFTKVVRRADFLIDSHSGGVRLAFAPVAGFYDASPTHGVDAATAAESLLLAKQMGVDFVWRLPPVPGVLSFEAMRCGIPTCGAEIGGRGNCRAQDAELYLRAYLSVLTHRGMIKSEARPLTTACLDGDWTVSPAAGYLETLVAAGDRVKLGQTIAFLRGPLGETIHQFAAAQDGRVMAVRHLNTVQVGDLATCVVRETTR
jgi:uncharacterized protein